MRLWHQELISKLPRQQLLGQHRECCALRGKGWGKPHSVVNYVFTYEPTRLYLYHMVVIKEMRTRGYKVETNWVRPWYRGKKSAERTCEEMPGITWKNNFHENFYPEHNAEYLVECIENLRLKGIEV